MLWSLHTSYATWNISIRMRIWDRFQIHHFSIQKRITFFFLQPCWCHCMASWKCTNWISSSFAFRGCQTVWAIFEPLVPQETNPNRLHPAHSGATFKPSCWGRTFSKVFKSLASTTAVLACVSLNPWLAPSSPARILFEHRTETMSFCWEFSRWDHWKCL